jgi:hypothetical protein
MLCLIALSCAFGAAGIGILFGLGWSLIFLAGASALLAVVLARGLIGNG